MTCQKYHVSFENTTKELQEWLGLQKKEIDEYMKRYWDKNNEFCE